MVDFRYHLVSIIAVFLALAVGIVFGTTTLNKALFDQLDNRVTTIDKDRDALRAENAALTKAAEGHSRFAKSVLPFAVAGRLAGEQVVIVATPESSSAVRDGVTEALLAAGATIAGRVELTKKFFDPAQSAAVGTVARHASNGAPLAEGTPLQVAANQLAIALAAPSRSAPGSSGVNSETTRVLRAFEGAELIRIDGVMPARSAAVVVVAPMPAKETDPVIVDQTRAVNDVIAAFGRQAVAVVAVAPKGSAVEGGALATLRGDEAVGTVVSSVDDADTAEGQAAVVFAVLERLQVSASADGERPRAGHYGDGPDADKPLPDLADIS